MIDVECSADQTQHAHNPSLKAPSMSEAEYEQCWTVLQEREKAEKSGRN